MTVIYTSTDLLYPTDLRSNRCLSRATRLQELSDWQGLCLCLSLHHQHQTAQASRSALSQAEHQSNLLEMVNRAIGEITLSSSIQLAVQKTNMLGRQTVTVAIQVSVFTWCLSWRLLKHFCLYSSGAANLDTTEIRNTHSLIRAQG